MKVIVINLLLATLLLLGACTGAPWFRLDGASFDDADLEQAKQTCRVERKLGGLQRAVEERDTELDQAQSDAERSRIKAEFDQINRQVYREIDTCMYKQGFRRP